MEVKKKKKGENWEIWWKEKMWENVRQTTTKITTLLSKCIGTSYLTSTECLGFRFEHYKPLASGQNLSPQLWSCFSELLTHLKCWKRKAFFEGAVSWLMSWSFTRHVDPIGHQSSVTNVKTRELPQDGKTSNGGVFICSRLSFGSWLFVGAFRNLSADFILPDVLFSRFLDRTGLEVIPVVWYQWKWTGKCD